MFRVGGGRLAAPTPETLNLTPTMMTWAAWLGRTMAHHGAPLMLRH